MLSTAALGALLEQLRLSQYQQKFGEEGWDDLNHIRKLDSVGLRRVTRDVGMTAEHASKFVSYFQAQRADSDTGTVQEFGDDDEQLMAEIEVEVEASFARKATAATAHFNGGGGGGGGGPRAVKSKPPEANGAVFVQLSDFDDTDLLIETLDAEVAGLHSMQHGLSDAMALANEADAHTKHLGGKGGAMPKPKKIEKKPGKMWDLQNGSGDAKVAKAAQPSSMDEVEALDLDELISELDEDSPAMVRRWSSSKEGGGSPARWELDPEAERARATALMLELDELEDELSLEAGGKKQAKAKAKAKKKKKKKKGKDGDDSDDDGV